ncbi:NitT/TauT family transport system substrate-binding protein [Natranaerovirga pectinivora]|uniref:NitT/TauT family transport system substrate-binding protein n=1 Tax=Natranaerovirga pectinivora TaxID=682400 RepID=A0A4R3MLQ2_9FIRM|nr:ABC transporter substrate-binding protein [Natranaerovirga pectinivora]TCT14617.1 NitT/TauT family transport system substrate-binding protein [Natranaerovirga pectinivora]
MKKILVVFVLIFVVFATTLTGCSKKDDDLITVRFNEVVHSVFYAPQYVAIEKGFFEEEGLKIDLSTGWGADNSMIAVLSGNADIGFMGSEASVYVYNEGQEDYVVNFALLCQRAGNFMLGREDDPNFTWDKVKGKTIVGGRRGGMPQMVLEYILKQNNITPYTDVNIITNIDFTATAGAFSGGTGDYIVDFEPTASALENEGVGTVVASLGVDSGYVPYTAYMARKSYIEKNPEIIQKFTNAIYKGQQWVDAHTPEEIAKAIKPQFPDTNVETLTQIVTRYKEQDTWRLDPLFPEEGFDLLQNILDEAGELSKRVPFEVLVDNSFANKAIE